MWDSYRNEVLLSGEDLELNVKQLLDCDAGVSDKYRLDLRIRKSELRIRDIYGRR